MVPVRTRHQRIECFEVTAVIANYSSGKRQRQCTFETSTGELKECMAVETAINLRRITLIYFGSKVVAISRCGTPGDVAACEPQPSRKVNCLDVIEPAAVAVHDTVHTSLGVADDLMRQVYLETSDS